MSRPQMFKLSSFQRSLIAIGLCVALMGALLQHRAQLREAEAQIIRSVKSTLWKVSELVFEAQRFATISVAYSRDPTGVDAAMLDALRLRFEVLWSRIDLVRDLDIEDNQLIQDALTELLWWRVHWDQHIFGSEPPTTELVQFMRIQLEPSVVALRRGWVVEFESGKLGDWAKASRATQERIQRQELMLAGLLCVMIFYLIFEVYFAARATRRERALRQTADRANQFKSDFIASVSHEVRTPLNGIISMAAHLSEQKLTADQRECLSVIQDSGGLLLSTINDVLDLAKIESGQMVLHTKVFDPSRCINLTRALYFDLAKDKGLALSVMYLDGPLPHVLGDERKFRQVLNNLVSNAVKFTETGGVEIIARYRYPSDTQDAGLEIVVADTGPGISDDMQARIFEPFAQDVAGLQRGSQGTGLGLSISSALCEAMQGSLSLESAPGRGARFKIALPLEAVNIDEKGPSPHLATSQSTLPQLADARVMVVDDNRTNRFVLRKLLETSGIEVLEAASGAEALEELAMHRVSAVLMDVQMPGMDGMETTSRFLEAEALARRLPPPVIGVTANVMPEQVDSYLAAGMCAVLPKPVSKRELLRMLAAHTKAGNDAPQDGVANSA